MQKSILGAQGVPLVPDAESSQKSSPKTTKLLDPDVDHN